jgi:ribosomal protein L11 methyltransferase
MSGPPTFPQVLIDVPEGAVDEAIGALFDNGAAGVEQRDHTTLASADRPGLVTLVASFETREGAEVAARGIDPSFLPRVEDLTGDGWRDTWKEHFEPFWLTQSIAIRPPWSTVFTGPEPGKTVLELEPGRAFGTGLHATTSLVANALEDHRNVFEKGCVLDVGTGSGILALTALALGAERVRGIDVDPDAVAVARENAARNGMALRADFDASPLSDVEGAYDAVAANIEARVLIPMAKELVARARPGGIVVLSGVLREQQSEVLSAFRGCCCCCSAAEDVREEGEWVAIVLERR